MQAKLNKLKVFKSFELRQTNNFLIKHLPRELIKKPLLNVNLTKRDALENSKRGDVDYLLALCLKGCDAGYKATLKKVIVDKVKDFKEYDLEMIHEHSRDFIS